MRDEGSTRLRRQLSTETEVTGDGRGITRLYSSRLVLDVIKKSSRAEEDSSTD